MPEQKLCGHAGCGKKLRDSNQSGFCTAHFYDSKRNGERRICSVAGCSGKLRTDNTTGLCKPHARPKPGDGGATRVSASPHKAKSKSLAPESAVPMVAVALSEAQLDGWWSKFSLEQKAAMLFSS